MSLVDLMLEATEEVDLELNGEECAEGCGEPLTNGEEVAGLMGEDPDGLPGFALFHQSCLSNRLLRLL